MAPAQTAFTFRKLNLVDLCSGVGMATLGLQSAGFEALLGVDIDPEVSDAYLLPLHRRGRQRDPLQRG
jgi:site-specific DNA-cytosine methylase